MKNIFQKIDSILVFDSPFMLRASRVACLIMLNMLWLLCCIPVITIGPATAAMHYVIFQYHTERSDVVAKPFFHAFRRDFRQGILLGLPVTIVCVLLGFNALYIYGNYPGTFHPLWIPFALMVAIVGAMMLYGFPLIARYNLSLKQIFGNAVGLLLQNPKFSFFGMAGYFLPVILLIAAPNFLVKISFLWVLLGGSVTAYLADRALLKIFEAQQED